MKIEGTSVLHWLLAASLYMLDIQVGRNLMCSCGWSVIQLLELTLHMRVSKQCPYRLTLTASTDAVWFLNGLPHKGRGLKTQRASFLVPSPALYSGLASRAAVATATITLEPSQALTETVWMVWWTPLGTGLAILIKHVYFKPSPTVRWYLGQLLRNHVIKLFSSLLLQVRTQVTWLGNDRGSSPNMECWLQIQFSFNSNAQSVRSCKTRTNFPGDHCL